MRRWFLVGVLSLLALGEASAQCSGSFDPGDFCGIPTIGPAGIAKKVTRDQMGVRERLSGARPYFVRPLGNDANCSGLVNANDPGSGTVPRACAFATPQKPITVVLNSLDLNNQTVTVDLVGAFTTGISCQGRFVGAGTVIVTSSTNASITTTNADAIVASHGCKLTINGGLTLSTVTTGNSLAAYAYGHISYSGITFGPAGNSQVQAGEFSGVGVPLGAPSGPGVTIGTGNYTITGGGQSHIHVTSDGSQGIILSGVTVTITGTPNFSAKFAGATKGLVYIAATFSGSATGQRYLTHRGSMIIVGTSSRTYLPGDVAGITVAGGSYIDFNDTLSDLGVIDLLGANSVAPSTPAAGYTYGWFDSTSKRFKDKGDGGVIGTTVVPDAGAASQFLTGIGTDGVPTKAQPTGADLATSPAFNGDATAGTFSALGAAGVAGNFTSIGGTVPTTPPAGRWRLYADVSGDLVLLKSDTFKRTITALSALTASRVYNTPNADATLVVPDAGTANNFLTAISTGGAISKAQPSFSNISGTMTNTQLPAKIAFRATKGGTAQTGIASGVSTVVTWGTEVFDVGSFFASDGWTPPSGIATLGAQIGTVGGASVAVGSVLTVRVLKNGTALANGGVQEAIVNGGLQVAINITDQCNGSDVYKIDVTLTTTAGTYDVSGSTTTTYFWGVWNGP